MTERVRNRDRAIGIEARLAADSVGDSDRSVSRVAPVAFILAPAEQVVKHLIDQRPRIERDGSTQEVDGGLHDGQSVPSSCVRIVDATRSHIKREMITCLPAECSAKRGSTQKRHHGHRVKPLIDIVLPESIE